MFKKYSVLGSNSFAGSTFIGSALQQGADIVGFNRSGEGSPIFLPYKNDPKVAGNYKFFQADINHNLDFIMSVMDKFQPEVVVDFAGQGMVAESWQYPEQWYSTNIVSKVRLHDQLRTRKWLKRYIRVSTPEVYGSQNSLTKESWSYLPTTPYAVSHAAIDMSLRAFYKMYDFPVIFTRFANFYGPCQQIYRIIPRAIISGLTGKKLLLHGGGTSIRSFIYGGDVAEGILSAANSGVLGDAYHFSSKEFFTIREVVETIFKRMGISFDSLVELAPDRPGKDQAYLMDSSKAREELGWINKINFEVGIDATIQWVKSSIGEIQTLPQDYIHRI